MIRLWLCPMVTAHNAELGADVRMPKAGLVLEGLPAAWSAIDLPGFERAVVFTDCPAAGQDALFANPDCTYLTPYGVETRAELHSFLESALGDLSEGWRDSVSAALTAHGLSLDVYAPETLVSQVLDDILAHHFRAQNPAAPVESIRWAVL